MRGGARALISHLSQVAVRLRRRVGVSQPSLTHRHAPTPKPPGRKAVQHFPVRLSPTPPVRRESGVDAGLPFSSPSRTPSLSLFSSFQAGRSEPPGEDELGVAWLRGTVQRLGGRHGPHGLHGSHINKRLGDEVTGPARAGQLRPEQGREQATVGAALTSAMTTPVGTHEEAGKRPVYL